MTDLNFRYRKCKKYFNCDVGKITFLIERERPHFEKNIVCPKCGILSMDDVELTEPGQTRLAAVYMSEI